MSSSGTDTISSSKTKELIPATDADTEHLRYFLSAMPFAGDMFAPHCKAVAYEPLPPVNARGGRDCEGWTCVYEAVVQDTRAARQCAARSSGDVQRLLCMKGQMNWLNGGQGLHGAAAAWLLDMLTGTSLHRLGTESWSPWGPSINFEINFYNPAPAGTVLTCETIVDRAGGAVSTVLCLISDKKTGRRILTGVHTTQRPKGGAFGKVGAKFGMKATQMVTAKL